MIEGLMSAENQLSGLCRKAKRFQQTENQLSGLSSKAKRFGLEILAWAHEFLRRKIQESAVRTTLIVVSPPRLNDCLHCKSSMRAFSSATSVESLLELSLSCRTYPAPTTSPRTTRQPAFHLHGLATGVGACCRPNQAHRRPDAERFSDSPIGSAAHHPLQ